MDAGPPPLPPDATPELRAFLACRADDLVLEPGPVTWLPWPSLLPRVGVPRARFSPTADGTVRITVQWGFVSLKLRAAVEHGELAVTMGGGRALGLDDAVGDWVRTLNAHLAANGKELASIGVERGAGVVRKTERRR
jgi:hypothetical protein